MTVKRESKTVEITLCIKSDCELLSRLKIKFKRCRNRCKLLHVFVDKDPQDYVIQPEVLE